MLKGKNIIDFQESYSMVFMKLHFFSITLHEIKIVYNKKPFEMCKNKHEYCFEKFESTSVLKCGTPTVLL